ncbi:hypothetical protein PIB30_023613 [Stylosanthes scabra]|uniref:RNase H type-1 domain-containing protein n=1 Tax=Stylosanthes scabra TaxID=79078 RepID=A0ABU6ZB63_9FABA|nr:hypothetical protein [Stylosanthes scabra]
MVGGFLMLQDDTVACQMGEEVDEKTKLEATIRGLEEVVQFLIEEVEIREEEITIVVKNKEIVEWIKGKDDTDWSQRFVRNRARNVQHLFDVIKLEHRTKRTLKEKVVCIVTKWTHIALDGNAEGSSIVS